jgi:hypothetical protein
MIDPDKETLKSVIALKHNRDFLNILKWFTDSLMIQSIENNGTGDEITFRIIQGRNLEDKAFIDHVENAEELFKTLNEAPKGVM